MCRSIYILCWHICSPAQCRLNLKVLLYLLCTVTLALLKKSTWKKKLVFLLQFGDHKRWTNTRTFAKYGDLYRKRFEKNLLSSRCGVFYSFTHINLEQLPIHIFKRLFYSVNTPNWTPINLKISSSSIEHKNILRIYIYLGCVFPRLGRQLVFDFVELVLRFSMIHKKFFLVRFSIQL